MAEKMLPPTQADVDEAALDGVQLVQQLGFQLDDEAEKRVAGRTSFLLAHASFLSLLFLYSEPITDGWSRK
jgi:hypothetical protein